MRKTLILLVAVLALLSAVSLFSPAHSHRGAPSPIHLRVMTYNVHVGVGMDKKQDLQRIADAINHERPDLVGLQEVDRGVKRTGGVDEITELARMTGMQFSFAHNLDYQGGQYGVAILSRFAILKIDHRKYQNTREAERRGLLRIEVNVGRRVLSFATTHLDYQFEDGRRFETEQLLGFLNGIQPLVLVGDFNEEPKGEAYKLMITRFRDAWLESKSRDAGLSYPADKPLKRIDYIFYGTKDRIRVQQAWTVNTLASDHVPVIADLELR